MIRPLHVLVALSTLGLQLVLPVAPARAHSVENCLFELFPPQRTTLPGGATGVTATAQATKCKGTAQPVKVTVCVASPADPPVCDTKYAWVPAKAFLGSTQPGVKLTVTGSGCSISPSNDSDSDASQGSCQSLGPLETTA